MNGRSAGRIAVLMADKSNPFWIDMEIHYRRLAVETGCRVECFWPPEHNPSAQSDVLMKIVGAGFDAIVINPMNGTNLLEGILKASEKGIPILDVGAKTDQRRFGSVPPDYVPIPTVDFLEQGRLGAEYIMEHLEPGRLSNVVILEGRPNSAQSIGRTNGALKIFEGHRHIRLLARAGADYDRKKAAEVAYGLLGKGAPIHAFFCVNDLMALGVTDVLGAKGQKPKEKPIIVGVDLIDEAREAIQKGLMDASVAFSRAEVAACVLNVAVSVVGGGKSPSPSPVSSHTVSRRNIGDYP